MSRLRMLPLLLVVPVVSGCVPDPPVPMPVQNLVSPPPVGSRNQQLPERWRTQSVEPAVDTTHSDRLLMLRPVQIWDRMGFGQPVVSRSFLVPAEWNVTGGVRWQIAQDVTQCFRESFVATAPDGQVAVEMLPARIWFWSAYQLQLADYQHSGKDIGPPMSATEFLHWSVSQTRPGAKIVMTRRHPSASTAQQSDAAEVIVEYESDGVDFRERFMASLSRFSLAGGSTMCIAEDIYGFRAPSAEFDRWSGIHAMVAGSTRINPVWQLAIDRFSEAVSRNERIGMQERARIMRSAQESVGQTLMATWEKRQESIDRVSVEFCRMIRGTELFSDPNSGQSFELPGGFDAAYINPLGQLCMTSNPGDDPNETSAQRWELLTRTIR